MYLNWLDLAFAIALIAGAAVGFYHGLLRLFFATVVMCLSFVLAAEYFHAVGLWLNTVFPSGAETALDSVGFTVIFLTTQVGVNILGRRAYRSTRLSRLGSLDQFGGLLVGLILTFSLVSIAATVMNIALSVTWASADAVRSPIAETATVSSLMPVFLAAVPSLAETVRPWLPAPLPPIFFL